MGTRFGVSAIGLHGSEFWGFRGSRFRGSRFSRFVVSLTGFRGSGFRGSRFVGSHTRFDCSSLWVRGFEVQVFTVRGFGDSGFWVGEFDVRSFRGRGFVYRVSGFGVLRY